MIQLSSSKKLKVLKKVRIKDNSWNMPGGSHLEPGTLVQVSAGPTRISDVPFIILEGVGQITHRHVNGETTRPIKNASNGFFFSQGHKTSSPYDFGTLDTECFEEIS